MKVEIMIAVIGIICIGALAAVFVLWAKLEEQKRLTQEERDNYFAALRIGNTNAEYAQRLDAELDKMKAEYEKVSAINDNLEIENINWNCAYSDMQDRLSILLCPKNNHIWIGGRCAKCGRIKDA